MREPEGSPPRAVAAILGASAVMLGGLNLMLAWHGGYEATPLPWVLVLMGSMVWALSRLGGVRRSA